MQDNIVLNIFNKIYVNLSESQLDIFLCGGASNKTYVSVRDNIRRYLDKREDFRVLYPEDLFIDLLNKNKEHDLLSLEKFLAANCDVICIVCESAGSLVELGAFTNNTETIDKVVAAISYKRRKDKSFIMLGPIKLLQKKNKDNVIFYKDVDDLAMQVREHLKRRKTEKYKKTKSNIRGVNTIIGQYYFILILTYYYKIISVKDLKSSLIHIYNHHGIDIKELNLLFSSTLKLLHKDKLINKISHYEDVAYTLTERGYKKVNKILNKVDSRLRDSIKFDIINNMFY